MKGEIKRLHLDLAGDAGFRDFEPGDLIMAKQRTGNGMFTAEAEVFAVGEDWVQVKCNNDFPHTDRLDWVRIGNTTDPNRRAFITLKGSGEGSPRQEFRARIASWKDLKSIDTLVMLEGNLDGVQHPKLGKLEGDGVLCTNLYAIGTFVLKSGDDISDLFKNQGGRIEMTEATIVKQGAAITATQEQYSSLYGVVEQHGETLSTHTSSIEQNAKNIGLKVDSNGVIAAINLSGEGIKIEASKIRLIGDTTLEGLLSAGKIKAEYIDADSIVTRKLRTADGGARIEINHEQNVIAGFSTNNTESFRIEGMSTDAASFSITRALNVPNGWGVGSRLTVAGLSVWNRSGSYGTTTNYSLDGITISRFDGYSERAELAPGKLLLRSSSSAVEFIVNNLPSGSTTDAHIKALPIGSVFIDSGQTHSGSSMLRIRVS